MAEVKVKDSASVEAVHVASSESVGRVTKVSPEDYDQDMSDYTAVKVICLGDSAVGKSKLVERFLADQYKPQRQSTYALTLYKYQTKVKDQNVIVDFWDTAGQEKFNRLHPSYYHQAHACILVFDTTRKLTYKNLTHWYEELRQHRPDIPCILVGNKIDVDYQVTKKSFKFARAHQLPFFFVSASDGTNVVKVFRESIKAAVAQKNNSTDFLDEVMRELETMDDLSSVQPPTRGASRSLTATSGSSSTASQGTSTSANLSTKHMQPPVD